MEASRETQASLTFKMLSEEEEKTCEAGEPPVREARRKKLSKKRQWSVVQNLIRRQTKIRFEKGLW